MSNDYFIFKHFTVNQEGCPFKVGTDGVLLGACANVSGKKKILDIGTGTGLISLMLAQRCKAEITAIEPDPNSFLQASANIRSSMWADRIILKNCLLQNLEHFDGLFNLIVCNPPYFIASLVNPDPSRAFARHNNSLTHQDILRGVSRLLAPDGLLQLILPPDEGNRFMAKASEYGFFCNSILKIRSVPSSGIKRVILGFTRQKIDRVESCLTIEKGRRHEYTEEYIRLTKDFYIKF